MDSAAPKLSRTSGGFAASAAIVVLLNTIVACAKDASLPLKKLLASPTGSDWTTQGLVDVIVFIVLGLILSNTSLSEKMTSKRLISFLVAAVVIAGVGLFAWYIFY